MKRPEQRLQIQIAKWCRHNLAPDVDFWSTPMNAKNAFTGGLLKSMGARPDVPDLIFSWGPMGFMEIKAEDGRPTRGQLEFLVRQSARGHYTAVVYSLEEAIETLERWGVPKCQQEKLSDEEALQTFGF